MVLCIKYRFCEIEWERGSIVPCRYENGADNLAFYVLPIGEVDIYLKGKKAKGYLAI